MLEVDQSTGSTYLQEANQATRSNYLYACRSCVHCTFCMSLSSCHPIMNKPQDTYLCLLLYLGNSTDIKIHKNSKIVTCYAKNTKFLHRSFSEYSERLSWSINYARIRYKTRQDSLVSGPFKTGTPRFDSPQWTSKTGFFRMMENLFYSRWGDKHSLRILGTKKYIMFV